MFPLGICKISEANMLTRLLKKKVPQPTASTCRFCWTAVVGCNSFSEMYVYARCFVQCCAIIVLILWSWKRLFDRLLITQFMRKRAFIYTVNLSTFPGGKAAGAWRWPATPSVTEFKERVELHLYSPCVPSWQVVGRTLRFIFYAPVHVYSPALEAASPTVFMVWLLAYMRRQWILN